MELLSDNSPVLIVKNEKQDRKREINEPQLRGRFSNLQKIVATIGTAIFIILIGVLQLRQDDRLSEINTVELIKMVLEQLPLIGNLIKQITGKN